MSVWGKLKSAGRGMKSRISAPFTDSDERREEAFNERSRGLSKAEGEKKYQSYVDTAESEQKNALDALVKVAQADARPFVSGVERMRVMQDLQTQNASVVEGASQRGMMHSGALLHAKQQMATQQALAQAALLAEEERRRSQELMNAEQYIALAKEAQAKVPDSYASPMRERSQVFEDETARMDARNQQIDGFLLRVREKRLSADEVYSRMQESIDSVYSNAAAVGARKAREMGLGDQDVQLMLRQLEVEKSQSMQEMFVLAQQVTSNTPAEAAAALQAMFTPERVEFIEQASNDNSALLFALGGGLIGGMGGYVVGGPVGAAKGAAAGYSAASSIGGVHR